MCVHKYWFEQLPVGTYENVGEGDRESAQGSGAGRKVTSHCLSFCAVLKLVLLCSNVT